MRITVPDMELDTVRDISPRERLPRVLLRRDMDLVPGRAPQRGWELARELAWGQGRGRRGLEDIITKSR